MAKRARGAWILDGLVGLIAILAVSMVVRDRVLPWIADRSVLDPGDTWRDDPSLLDAETGAPVVVDPGTDHLVLVFRSTCAACDRALPGWRRLADGNRWRVIAVGLESRESALTYARSRLPGTRVAVPGNLDEFTRRLRIGVVPTTLVIDHGGRLAARHAGPLEASVVEALRLEPRPRDAEP